MKTSWTKASPTNAVTERETAHKELARRTAAESIVLLKNDGVLPISIGNVALFGAGAAATIKGGTGSGEVNERHSVTIWEGLRNAGFTITTDDWLSDYITLLHREKKRFYKKFFRDTMRKALFGGEDERINILAGGFHYPVGQEIAATNADTCIYVIARQAGECTDRNLSSYEYTLEPGEISNIRKAAEGYKNTIVVINVGSSMDLSPLDGIDGINAIIYFCQQGMEGGNAFADIITGKTSPSGCLTNTWAMRYDDIPFAQEYSYLKGTIGKEYYKEGIYVGYRYFDSFNVTPRYEFGYGLTYPEFTIECTGVKTKASHVTVSVKVTNTDIKHSGKKTVQLYISCPSGKLRREYQSLAAFAKTKILKPGKSDKLKLEFDLTDLAGYDEAASAFILEAGDYVLRLGSSSRDNEVAAVISLDDYAKTEQCKSVCPLKCELEVLKAPASIINIYPDVHRASIKSKSIKTITHDYTHKTREHNPTVSQWMRDLTFDEKLKFLMGAGLSTENPGLNVPGAAAITTADFLDRGIPNVALCDGPAGVRVARTAVIKRSGEIKMLEPGVEMLHYAPAFMKARICGNPKQGNTVYQYTTAFPVGTALAQTWNTELMQEFGEAINTEMKEYGVTFWLAPGMNIQRNPLCGRNYEYYSEDPLLTGKIAAAITQGVQSSAGCYVTVKHYAANNQEHMRNRSDSVMTERTLREIYLKGFKIAVKESDAKAVMTSYNLLNGIYTPNSYDLCTKLLRHEWGFRGVVMTDWLSTGKSMAGNGLAIKAGNDLIMPGGKRFMKWLKQDIKNNIVTEEEINLACSNVLEAIANSNVSEDKQKA